MPGIKILLIGKKFSGKTTVANYLVDKYGFKEFVFAEPLKKVCKTIFNLSDSQLYNHEYKEQVDLGWNYSPREMFQLMGDILRDEMPKYFPKLNTNSDNKGYKIFTQIMNNKISKLNPDENFVISDGRLPDEVEWFKTLPNSVVIKIVRNTGITPGFVGADTHKTENLEYEADYVVNNDGGLDELYNSINKIIEKLVNNH